MAFIRTLKVKTGLQTSGPQSLKPSHLALYQHLLSTSQRRISVMKILFSQADNRCVNNMITCEALQEQTGYQVMQTNQPTNQPTKGLTRGGDLRFAQVDVPTSV
jgi:hypothetical protein